MNIVQKWFLQRSAREQLILVAAAIGLSLFLSIAFVLSPLAAKNQELVSANRGLATDLAWLQQATADFSLLQRSRGGDTGKERNLAQATETAARARGIRIDRLQAGKNGGVQVWLKNTEFSRVARWFHDLEYKGDTIIQKISIIAARDAGLVNVQARLQY